jgi:radical SAM superfamily enzyme YgiQ (UPF0313 family)
MKIALVYMNTEMNVGRGAGYIAGAVLDAGHSLSFFDSAVIPPKQVARQIVRENYDVLLVSTMTLVFPMALNMIRYVKQHSNPVVLVGGIHPTIIGEPLLEEHSEIDYLCIGEGETMVTEFLNHLGSNSLFEVNNLAYRQDGQVFANRLNPPEDLTTIPTFPWQAFSDQAIVQKPAGFLYVTATRGCPYNCTYCCNGIYLKHYGKDYIRFRPVDQVMEELTYLKNTYRPDLFYFGDEMILADTTYAVSLFKAVKQQLSTAYGCMIRVEHITPEIARILKETGCQYVGMGIECGDKKFRREHLNRFMSNRKIMEAFQLLKAAGIFTTSYNMIGYPFENDADLTRETVRLNQAVKPDYAQVTIFHPFPGTKLYDHCLEKDLIDAGRMATRERYYGESVLKGYKLQQERINIEKFLNPQGFRFKPVDRRKASRRGLRMDLKKTGTPSMAVN